MSTLTQRIYKDKTCIYHFTDIKSYYRTLNKPLSFFPPRNRFISVLHTIVWFSWVVSVPLHHSHSEWTNCQRVVGLGGVESESRTRQTRRTREKNQFGSFVLTIRSFERISSRLNHLVAVDAAMLKRRSLNFTVEARINYRSERGNKGLRQKGSAQWFDVVLPVQIVSYSQLSGWCLVNTNLGQHTPPPPTC